MEVTRNDTAHQIIHELLSIGKALPEEKARALAKTLLAEGEEAVTFLLLEIAMRVKESKPSPSTPSGMIPPYEKESAQTNKKKRKSSRVRQTAYHGLPLSTCPIPSNGLCSVPRFFHVPKTFKSTSSLRNRWRF